MRIHRQPAGAVDVGAALGPELRRERRRADAGGPDHRPCRDSLGATVRRLDRRRLPVDGDHGAVEHRRDAELAQLPRGALGQRLRERRQQPVAELDEQHARAARVDQAEVAAQRVARQLTDLAGHLDAGRPAAHDDEGQLGVALLLAGAHLGPLERRQQPRAHDQRALERLHLGGDLGPLVVAEVGVAGPGRDDQGVVGQRRGRLQAAGRSERDLARLEVEARHLGEQHAHVAVAAEQHAKRIGDLSGRQRPGGDLVGQGLEQMEVAPVDERDVHRRVAQPLDGVDAGEPATDDDDPVAIAHAFTEATKPRTSAAAPV